MRFSHQTRVVFTILLFFVAGCSSLSTHTLKDADLPDDPFYHTLAKEYMSLAEFETNFLDISARQKLMLKAEQASKMENIEPEPVPPILTRPYQELSNARTRLASVLASQTARDNPEVAAISLASFDCWAIQYIGNSQKYAAQCRENFYTNLRKLDDEEMPFLADTPVKPEKIEEIALNLKLPQSYLISFTSGSLKISPQDRETLDTVASVIEALNGQVAISIIGHTDTVGDADKNRKISLERALLVEDELRERTSKIIRIDLRGAGEEEVLVITDNNVPEPLNRRVEIILR